jgi:Phage integrase family
MNSLIGILRNLAWLLTELWCSAIGLILNPVNLHLARSTFVSVPCGDSHTRPPTAVSSAPIWRLGQPLWQAPDHQRLKGKRDRALLALLLACGLRRHEAVALRLDHREQREEHWAIVDLVGKGGHVRTVPVPDWVKTELDDWLAAAAIDRGKLFRRVNKVGRTWGDGMTVKAVWHIVKESAKRIGVANLSPHDLRRYARLCHASGGELEQIQFLLGTFPCKRPNATLAASSGFDQPSMIALASSRILEPGARLWKDCRPSESYAVVAHLDILMEALYRHLECLLKNRKNASSCCKARWIF